MFAKTVILLGWLAAVSVSSPHLPSPRSAIDTEVKKIILAEFQKIPEPLTVTNTDVTIPQNDYVEGDITVNSAIISGLSAAEIPSLKVTVLELKVAGEIEFENISINASLHQNITSNSVTYDNDVTANIVLEQLKVDFSGKYVVLKGHVHALTVKATLGSSSFQLTGLLGNDLISAVVAETLTSNLANWINADTTIFPQISTYLEDAINAYLDSKKVVTNKLDAIFLPNLST